MLKMAKHLVTDKELHELYPHLSLWTINNLRRQNKIPYIQLPGVRRYFYDLEKIEHWLSSLQNNI